MTERNTSGEVHGAAWKHRALGYVIGALNSMVSGQTSLSPLLPTQHAPRPSPLAHRPHHDYLPMFSMNAKPKSKDAAIMNTQDSDIVIP